MCAIPALIAAIAGAGVALVVAGLAIYWMRDPE
jgi:hypothetical protein